ncbi:MAG: hypothetical protein HQM13_02465 [SAR324 cluster bacterium]|nr:hypothetical protein [SAR324 cluster bacterium]
MIEELIPVPMKKSGKARKIVSAEELLAELQKNVKIVRGRPRIACSIALRISADSSVSPKRISRICKEAGIKIRSCMLDCFE